MIEPIDKCISLLKSERNYDAVIYVSPDGDLLKTENSQSFILI